MSDNDIAPRVRALLALLGLDMHVVRATVEQGIVYVEGVVPNIALRQAVDAQLGRLPGVRQVINCLAVEHVARLPHAEHALIRAFDGRLLLFRLVAGGATPPKIRGVSRTAFRDC